MNGKLSIFSAEWWDRVEQKLVSNFKRVFSSLSSWFKRQNKWKMFFWTSASFFLLMVVFLGGMALLTYNGAFGKLPTYADLKQIKNNTASEVYSEDGVLLRKYFVENRVNADFEEISPNIINALIATEDARFFEHGGIDLRAWGRVFIKTILLDKSSAGGGSTLSQQLVKNLYGRKDYFAFSILINKLKETFVARRLERLYKKEELLRLYLNTVPFGDNLFGIKVASQKYFNKSPKELEIQEAAVLVGMLKANSYYHPVRHPDRAMQRRNTVLNQMVRYEYLPELQLDSIQKIPLTVIDYKKSERDLGMYFTEHLRMKLEKILQEHKKPNGKAYDLYKDGLRIYTTIDAKMQRYAEEAVAEHLSKLQLQYYQEWKTGIPWGKKSNLERAIQNSDRYKKLEAKGLSREAIDKIFDTKVKMTVFNWKDGGNIEKEMSPLDSVKYYLSILNAGFLAMDPQAGLIKAWVGGVNYQYFQYDHVKSKRQVGSTFKPIVYAKALQGGMLPCEYTPNRLVRYIEHENWEPRNSDGAYGGVYSMEGALSKSINATSVEILFRAGVDSVKMLAQQLGISSDIPEVPSIALGTMSASLQEMVKVYSAFANGGKRVDIHYLDRIETSSGELIVSFDRPDPNLFESVLEEETNNIMIKMMESVIDSGTARRIRYHYGLYNDIAGKTGTTQNHSDGWFIGFTPKIAAGAWVGAELPSIHFKSLSAGQGANTALPIWGLFMKKLYKDPNFKSWKRAKFPSLSEESWAYMQCPPYLEEMPILIADYWNENVEEFLFIQRRLAHISTDKIVEAIQKKPKRRFENIFEYTNRLENYLERMNKREVNREKRKNNWTRLLFGKKKQN